jgi:hypothetical protein
MQIRIAKINGDLVGELPADLANADNLSELVELNIGPSGEILSERIIRPALTAITTEIDTNG